MPKSATEHTRRDVLQAWSKWILAVGAALFFYPLARFSSFRIPRKPRLIEVPAPLPLSGVHVGLDFLLFSTASGVTALSRTCTHLGCRLNYLEDKHLIECPCHQSQFTTVGLRIAGPAEKNLPRYPVRLKKNEEGLISAYVVEM